MGEQLTAGSIVVYESTVYPGATEEICLPELEKASGLKGGADFTIGYSPERINPGDREHTFTRIRKVVSGQTPETARVIADVYGSVVEAGVFVAASIKVAEAAKVIENTQRDLNIALMNELSLIFTRIGIDTLDVLEAAGTKWNFLKFSPGLVGGHCIGVDPYYLTHKAEQLGYRPEVILAGRRINDSMGEVIADRVMLELFRRGASRDDTRVTVLGLTFKENVSDLRNSGVARVIKRLKDYGVEVQVSDPLADAEEAKHEYDVELKALQELKPSKAVILAVSHHQYTEQGWSLVERLLEKDSGVVADVKGTLPREQTPVGITLVRL